MSEHRSVQDEYRSEEFVNRARYGSSAYSAVSQMSSAYDEYFSEQQFHRPNQPLGQRSISPENEPMEIVNRKRTGSITHSTASQLSATYDDEHEKASTGMNTRSLSQHKSRALDQSINASTSESVHNYNEPNDTYHLNRNDA